MAPYSLNEQKLKLLGFEDEGVIQYSSLQSSLPIPILAAHYGVSIFDYMKASLVSLNIDSDHGTSNPGQSDLLFTDMFLREYPRSSLALYVKAGGIISSTCEPSFHGFTWSALLDRGRRGGDPFEVNEFFFGFEPLANFDAALYQKLPYELRKQILLESLEPRTVELLFSENADAAHPGHTEIGLFCSQPPPSLVQVNKYFRSQLVDGESALYKPIFDHRKCSRFCFPPKETVVLRQKCTDPRMIHHPSDPIQDTLSGSNTWKANFIEANKKKHKKKKNKEKKKVLVLAIDCKFAHISSISGHEFLPWRGESGHTEKTKSINHCCEQMHDGSR
ncbi:uncharacterized protein LY89DRAFT_673041 [Mollisia scopiformis]|uniref:2EXR domain-containing protein n=1 Tax=Mollisia scopiformis TaxID=149040 RepID=A0A194WY92_MOLSC|nr:uncharacterized protein LY89DRAFT_673041 [Mollisia scopiformis]KUJ12936.1 hypothetical protein LY89DRAFT_673041 [Mollisia scopiformis]